jgi:ankyrin repeat protein
MRGNIECVQLLERYGQDLEQLTRSGRTPLEIAAAYGQGELVDYLLSKHCTMETLPKPLKHSKVTARQGRCCL